MNDYCNYWLLCNHILLCLHRETEKGWEPAITVCGKTISVHNTKVRIKCDEKEFSV